MGQCVLSFTVGGLDTKSPTMTCLGANRKGQGEHQDPPGHLPSCYFTPKGQGHYHKTPPQS